MRKRKLRTLVRDVIEWFLFLSFISAMCSGFLWFCFFMVGR